MMISLVAESKSARKREFPTDETIAQKSSLGCCKIVLPVSLWFCHIRNRDRDRIGRYRGDDSALAEGCHRSTAVIRQVPLPKFIAKPPR